MAAIALLLTVLALAAAYYGVQALAARVRSLAVLYFVTGGVLFCAAIIVTIVGHALVI